jgi:cyclopropane-fatty-acyl-phospholipid synthase
MGGRGESNRTGRRRGAAILTMGAEGMIYQFTTRAGGRITYTSTVGAQILHIVGKNPGPRGVITVAEVPAALAALEAAVARERARPPEEQQAVDPHDTRGNTAEEDERDRDPPVSLAQRVYPFVDLLKFALREQEDVTWGL